LMEDSAQRATWCRHRPNLFSALVRGQRWGGANDGRSKTSTLRVIFLPAALIAVRRLQAACPAQRLLEAEDDGYTATLPPSTGTTAP
jgi:hypothetical protein